jgi:hypothetical protein
MPRTRKTIDVAVVLDAANFFIANSPDEEFAERRATANLLELVLSNSGNYKGFRYLNTSRVDGELDFGDETRRHYH